jgi:hypothetical protein
VVTAIIKPLNQNSIAPLVDPKVIIFILAA